MTTCGADASLRLARRAAVGRALPVVSVAVVLVVLLLLVLHVGSDAFLDGLRLLDPPTVLAAGALSAVATLAASWRWTVLARALGDPLPLGTALRAYLRSQLLNTVLPGGVLGDVHRAVGGAAPAGRGARIRAVLWDRGSGQAVQAVLLCAALLLAAPDRWPVVAAIAAAPVAGLAALRGARGRLRVLRDDAIRLLHRPRVLATVVVASVVVTLAHALVFVLAALVTGAAAAPPLLLLVALAVQAATVVPLGLGGWGVREGAAAALFAGAGMGAAHGVSAAVATGALALLGVLPGVLPLVVAHRRGRAAR
ncbi:MAG: lysylphosphatidylglycerol synthase domain-containing protein [Amnibacterium sp.]